MRNILTDLINEFYAYNFPAFVRRDIDFPELPHKATVIMGMRRTGKTWLCYQRMRELLDSGVDKSRLLYLNFEDDRLFDFTVKDFQTILDVYFAQFPDNKEKLCYFFFDEIQTVDHWERFIRRLIDTENVQITLTGSSSRLLSSEIATSLRGRTISCEVFPYSFKEYLNASGVLSKVPDRLTSAVRAKLRRGIQDYFRHGGFPETVSYSDRDRLATIQTYIDTVLFRDVVERYRVSNTILLRHLLNAILNAPAQKFSVNKFYNAMRTKGIKGSKNDLYLYLEYLADAYFLYPVPIHTESERVRHMNPSKLYTVDTGIFYGSLSNREKNYGALLENLVFTHLRRQGTTIEYIDAAGYEVDFLAIDRTGKRSLIQVSYDLSEQSTLQRECRALQAASDSLDAQERRIVTWDDERELDGNIEVIPVWKFLLS